MPFSAFLSAGGGPDPIPQDQNSVVNALDPASGLGLPTGLRVFGCDVRCPLPPLFPRVGGGILIIEALTTPPSPVVGGGSRLFHTKYPRYTFLGVPSLHVSQG